MTPFHEGGPPLSLTAGTHGGPQRRTEIVALASGREERNTPWSHGRRRFDIGGAIASLDELHALASFFEARRGRLQAFRFRDPMDWKSCPPLQTPSPLDQPLGAGDGAAMSFQLVKVYGDGEDAYVRPIRKPAAGTIVIAADGEPVLSFETATDTGVVTFATPPAEGVVLTAGYAFDVPVRFDTDHLDLTIEARDAGRAPSVPLVEVMV